MRFLATDVLPRLDPTVRLRVVGHGGAATRRWLARLEAVGAVDDVRPWLAGATWSSRRSASAPACAARSLEALAMGRPVVTTSLGAEGLGAVDGRHLLVADDAARLRRRRTPRARRPALAARLGAEGRALVEAASTGTTIADAHEAIYDRVLRDRTLGARPVGARAFAIPARPWLRGWPAIAAGGVRLAGRALAWHARALLRARETPRRRERHRRGRSRDDLAPPSSSARTTERPWSWRRRTRVGRGARTGGEVLVVDNASTDDTPLPARDPGARRARAARRPGGRARALGGAQPRARRGAWHRRRVSRRRRHAPPRLARRAPRAVRRSWRRLRRGSHRAALRVLSPAWLTPALHASFSAFDLGPAPKRLRYRHDDYPFGANISFRTDAARAAGGFSTAVGPLGRHQLVFDETDLCFRLDQAAWEIHYVPDAVVDHLVLPERLTPEWVLERHRTGGESEAVFVLRNRRLLRALWRVWWRHRAALAQRPYAVREPIDPERFAAECRRRDALGYLTGLLRGAPRLHALTRDLVA